MKTTSTTTPNVTPPRPKKGQTCHGNANNDDEDTSARGEFGKKGMIRCRHSLIINSFDSFSFLSLAEDSKKKKKAPTSAEDIETASPVATLSDNPSNASEGESMKATSTE